VHYQPHHPRCGAGHLNPWRGPRQPAQAEEPLRTGGVTPRRSPSRCSAGRVDIPIPERRGTAEVPFTVLDDPGVQVRGVAVTHGHVVPASGYRFDTAGGSVVFSGDTTVNEDLVGLARGADILVHCVADLDYLERHGFTGAALERMAGLHTDVSDVGAVAQRAGVKELILTHYLPAEPEAISSRQWAERASRGFVGKTVAGTDGLRRTLSPLATSSSPATMAAQG
jgi:ribonuclease BN (tRNA processing enzyme)